MIAEAEARRTAAAAVVADLEREVDAYTRRRTDKRPDMATWALRLRDHLKLLLEEPDPAATQLAAIRNVFEVFDWDAGDRKYALEEIEDILRDGAR